MKTITLLIGLFLFFIRWNTASSQSLNTGEYKFAVGLRAGETSGIDLRYNNREFSSVEGLIGLWNDAASFTGLYEINSNLSETAGLKWYYGGGGHVAFATATYYIDNRRYIAGNDAGLGLDAIIGLEYKILPIPLTLSLDLKPFIEFKSASRMFFAFDPGVAVRFVF